MTSSLVSDSSITYLPIASIDLPKIQPRQHFDPEKISALAESIKAHGVLEPIIVRPLTQDRYELVAGERRLRASQEAGLASILSHIRDLTSTQAQKIALVENLQREDLNPVEEVDGILYFLGLELQEVTQTEWSRKQVSSLLHRMQNEVKGKVTHKVMGSAKSQVVEQVFEGLGMTWQSFIANKLPVLKWPDDVLEQTKMGAIAFENAKIIARLKDGKERKKLLKKAIAQSLSNAEIKKCIKDRKARNLSNPSAPAKDIDYALTSEISAFKTTVRNTCKSLRQHPSISDDPERLAQAEQLFNLFLVSLDRLLEIDSDTFYD